MSRTKLRIDECCQGHADARSRRGEEEMKSNYKEGSQMRITICLIGVVIVAGLLLVPVPLKAHHAFSAAFDENKPLNLQGKVTKVELVNPHSWLWIDVTSPDGKVTNWGVGGGPSGTRFPNRSTKT